MMRKNSFRIVKILLIALFLFSAFFAYKKGMNLILAYTDDLEQKATISQISSRDIILASYVNSKSDQAADDNSLEIKEKAYLNVPFVTQAPFENSANWQIHEESCEEAAIYQVWAYLNKINDINRDEADRVFRDMIRWQNNILGSHHDLHADELKKFITGYFPDISPDRVVIYKDAALADIKKEISRGNPIIAPITGELLGNPYYPYPGYHMLTIIGYTSDRVIANDVGTKRGKNYSYENEKFLYAWKNAGGELIIILPE